jgi:hypothetical protein
MSAHEAENGIYFVFDASPSILSRRRIVGWRTSGKTLWLSSIVKTVITSADCSINSHRFEAKLGLALALVIVVVEPSAVGRSPGGVGVGVGFSRDVADSSGIQCSMPR